MSEHPTLDPKVIRKKLRKFNKDFALYRKRLEQYFGPEAAESLQDQAFAYYRDLLPQTPRFEGRGNIFNLVLTGNAMVVAFHKAMRDAGHPVIESARIVYEVVEEMHLSIPRPLRWLMRQFIFSRRFLSIAKRSSEHVADHPMGWTIEYARGDGKTSDLFFACSRCGVIRYYQTHGVEEMAQYCNIVDYVQGRVLGLGLVNPDNIGQGDPVCRELMKRGRETPIPKNLREVVQYDMTKGPA